MGWCLECCILEDNLQFSPWPKQVRTYLHQQPQTLVAQIVGWQLGESNPTAIICLKPPTHEV